MALFKCKMCGGSIDVPADHSVIECEYCGTKQTLPKLDDERKANLYDRANHFRRNNDFDKAMAMYESILNEDTTDAEAYWSIVLCRFGIEYVEDPATRRRVPTVNRMQYTSILADEDYRAAIANADAMQKSIYEQEAAEIDAIQKGILAISQKEEPFDVFICYKETDQGGRRTQDSVLAQELYYGLKNEGFKVFFSRITLEDKLGSAYEPYIFAALNSAKVMVVLGTRPNYFNAVWVKNEWSRYLALIKSGAKKMLIPAYRDMDPYDLPEEFSHLQAQDMSKLGFMQDLTRGIKKILNSQKPQTAETVAAKEPARSDNSRTVAPAYLVTSYMKRAFMFLEDGEWDSANEYCEKVLDIDPENADAYLGKLMAETHVDKKENLANLTAPFDDSPYYRKAIRFCDKALLTELEGYLKKISEKAKQREYDEAVQTYGDVSRLNVSELKALISCFKALGDYRESEAYMQKCLELYNSLDIEEMYKKACRILDYGFDDYTQAIDGCNEAISIFEGLGNYRDSKEQLKLCIERRDEFQKFVWSSGSSSGAGNSADNKAAKSAPKSGISIAVIVLGLAIGIPLLIGIGSTLLRSIFGW